MTRKIFERRLRRLMVPCSIRRSGFNCGSILLPFLDFVERHAVHPAMFFIWLHKEEKPDGLIFDAVHHVLEHLEGLLLVLDKRILLSVAAEADSFLQMVHR